MKIFWRIALLLALLSSCNGAKNGNNQTDPNQKRNSKGGYLKFKPAALNDPSSTGEALTLLVPDGWKMQGRVIWTLDNSSYPATGQLQITDPSGQMKFEYF